MNRRRPNATSVKLSPRSQEEQRSHAQLTDPLGVDVRPYAGVVQVALELPASIVGIHRALHGLKELKLERDDARVGGESAETLGDVAKIREHIASVVAV